MGERRRIYGDQSRISLKASEVWRDPEFRKYFNKQSPDYSTLCADMLDALTKMEARARIAEQERAELVECLRAAIDYIDALRCRPGITAEQRAAHMRLWDLSPRALLAKHIEDVNLPEHEQHVSNDT